MGVFKEAKQARATGGPRQYFVGGDYLLEVQKIEFKQTRKKLLLWAVEGKVLEFHETEDSPSKPPAVGSIVSWATLSDKDVFWGNIKGFTVALAAESEEVFDEQISEDAYEAYCEALSGSDQVATGWLIRAQVRGTPGDDGIVRFFPRWIGVPLDEQPEAVQAGMAEVFTALMS